MTLKCEAISTDRAPLSDTDVEIHLKVLSQLLHFTSVRTVSLFVKVSLSHPAQYSFLVKGDTCTFRSSYLLFINLLTTAASAQVTLIRKLLPLTEA